jgi:hypothetical protein
MTMHFPPFPELPDEQRRTGDVSLRYEDFSQDGRVQLSSLVHACGPLFWSRLPDDPRARRTMQEQGIVPVLSRLVLEGRPGSFTLARPFTATGGYQLAHASKGDEVERLLILMWCEISGPRGRLFGPQPAGAGEQATCGRFFAENVFTRLFAPAEQRKVVRFEIPGLPAIPEHRHTTRPHGTIVALPDGAVPLEPTLSPDLGPLVFGVCHTDANQHVNSLVYPRMFEEAAIRRFAALGVPAPGLARGAEIGFRKPCFAGDRVRILLQVFVLGERRGAVGVFIGESDMASSSEAKPHCYLKMIFE